jgi:DNA polymerase-3 subunit epsilon
MWALDLETGGFDPSKHDIVSVGMVPIRAGTIRQVESFYSLVRPTRPMSPDSIAIHGIKPEELEGAPRLRDVLPDINARLQEGVLLVHYATIDVPFLRDAYSSNRLRWPRPAIVDTARLLIKLHRRDPFGPRREDVPTTLWQARAHFGLPEHRRHHALSDAVATAELFVVLADRLHARRLRNLL